MSRLIKYVSPYYCDGDCLLSIPDDLDLKVARERYDDGMWNFHRAERSGIPSKWVEFDDFLISEYGATRVEIETYEY